MGAVRVVPLKLGGRELVLRPALLISCFVAEVLCPLLPISDARDCAAAGNFSVLGNGSVT